MSSIRARLMVGTAIGVAAMFAIASVVIYWVTRSSLYAQFDDGLAARARTLSALVEQEGDAIETDLAREEVAGEYHQLWVGDRVLRRSRSLGSGSLRPAAAIEHVVLPDGRAGRQATLRFSPHQSADEVPRAAPIEATFAVARGVEEVETATATLRRVLILVGSSATLLTLAILLLAIRIGLRPVDRLASSIAELRESGRLVAAASPRELQPVVARLNELLDRVEGAVARERELTADVAHELRTPLAGLRATIELARSRDRTPERYVAALDDCLAIVLQTERTITTLLALARLDAGQGGARRDEVALGELVSEVLGGIELQARKLVVERAGEATWVTDRDKLRVVLANLLDNAAAYADVGGTIRIELAAKAIVVSNTGCTLKPEDAGRVFERFWRGDQARNERGHVGLGLALSKKLIEVQGGTLTAEVIDGRFVVTIAPGSSG